MSGNTKVGNSQVDEIEFEWHTLTQIERCLIEAYRRLNDRERQHLRRFTDVLASNPEQRPTT